MPDARQKGRRDVFYTCAVACALGIAAQGLHSTGPSPHRRTCCVQKQPLWNPSQGSGVSPTFQVFTVGFRFDLQAHPQW